MPGRTFTYDCWRCLHWEVGVPIAPIKISLPHNRTAMVLLPSCHAHYCGQTLLPRFASVGKATKGELLSFWVVQSVSV